MDSDTNLFKFFWGEGLTQVENGVRVTHHHEAAMRGLIVKCSFNTSSTFYSFCIVRLDDGREVPIPVAEILHRFTPGSVVQRLADL